MSASTASSSLNGKVFTSICLLRRLRTGKQETCRDAHLPVTASGLQSPWIPEAEPHKTEASAEEQTSQKPPLPLGQPTLPRRHPTQWGRRQQLARPSLPRSPQKQSFLCTGQSESFSQGCSCRDLRACGAKHMAPASVSRQLLRTCPGAVGLL